MAALRLVIVSLLVSSAASALTPTAQDRHVTGSHYLYSAPLLVFAETVAAPDYGTFVAETDGFPPTSPPPFPPFSGPAIVTQDSRIEAEALHASGTSLAEPGNPVGDGHVVESESLFSVDFTLDAGGPYTTTGQIDLAVIDCAGDAAGFVRLIGPGGVLAEVANQVFSNGSVSLPLESTLVLEPGSYTLEARAWTVGEGGDGPHAPPSCPGEVNARFEVDFGPTPPVVPALPPAALSLLGVVLLGAARAASRRAS